MWRLFRIGSDEDDEGDDAEYSNEDPSDTAVSHDYRQYSDDMCARDTAAAAATTIAVTSPAGGEPGEPTTHTCTYRCTVHVGATSK